MLCNQKFKAPEILEEYAENTREGNDGYNLTIKSTTNSNNNANKGRRRGKRIYEKRNANRSHI